MRFNQTEEKFPTKCHNMNMIENDNCDNMHAVQYTSITRVSMLHREKKGITCYKTESPKRVTEHSRVINALH